MDTGELDDVTRRQRSSPQLGETDLAVYRHAVTRGHLDPKAASSELAMDPAEVAQACQSLVRLKLLNDQQHDALTPVHPDLAAVMLNEPLIEQIRDRERVIEANSREFRRISDILTRAAAQARGADGIRVVADPGEVQREIDSAILRCADEFVMTQPGGRGSHSGFAKLFPEDRPALKPGVGARVLCQHSARADLGMRSHIGRVTEHGGTVRTTSTVLEHTFIFDHHTAFVPLTPPQGDPHGAAVITHHAVVSFVCRSFERLWGGALPFEDNDAQYDWAATDIKISLLRLMASGLKDDAIAGRLGLATRTCRRHISQIMNELGATSRFEAGVKIAKLDILSEPDNSALQSHRADAHPAW